MILKFFNAKNGDAIHLATNTGKNIILDMGYAETYYNYIKSHIMKIRDINQKIDLLVISHIDQDHIEGALSFLQDVCREEFDKKIINEVWHNSYRHLSLAQVKNIGEQDYRVLRTLKENCETENNLKFSTDGNKEISAKQGSTLAGLIYKLGTPWNKVFDGMAACGIRDINFEGLNITILTPSLNTLEKLKRFWRSELIGRKFDFQFGEDELFDDAYEFYLLNEAVFENDEEMKIAYDAGQKFQELLQIGINKEVVKDSSITNASSISLIIEDEGKRALLTADATDDDLFNALKSLSNKGVSMEFDLIKLSHHGSIKNNLKWLSMVKAKYYVISTDSSKHNHPDLESIVNLIKNNKDHNKIICFNNYVKAVVETNNPSLIKEYNYSILLPNQDWGIEIEL